MTAVYTERVQTMLTAEQFALLSDVAQEENKALSVLVREAIEATYLAAETRRLRRNALDQLLQLDAPVREWPDMEREILKGVTS